MALIITGIGNKGALSDERVGFRVTSKCDLKHFLLFRTTLSDSGFYNRSKDAFWFAPTDLNIGDKVVLFTKQGADSFQNNDDNTITYFRYWGLTKPIFTGKDNGVVLAEIDSWSSTKTF